MFLDARYVSNDRGALALDLSLDLAFNDNSDALDGCDPLVRRRRFHVLR
ncbi:MAG: hypothetical protein ACI9DC_004469 [Gammaproteobacteria bacterium]|jgi:hypothetical protein